ESTLVKAANRLGLAGMLDVKPTKNHPIDDIFFQNINWDMVNSDWIVSDEVLEERNEDREEFRAFIQGALNLFGTKKFKNARESEGVHRLLAFKLIRAWPQWKANLLKRVWDPEHVRHRACINSISQFVRVECERNRRLK